MLLLTAISTPGRAVPAPSLAARLAAKEAAFKALAGSEEARRIGWRDLEVERESDGRPRLILHGRAEARAAELGVRRIHLTLTHTHATAAAVVSLASAGGARSGKRRSPSGYRPSDQPMSGAMAMLKMASPSTMV